MTQQINLSEQSTLPSGTTLVLNGAFQLTTGAVAGYVLTSDASGFGTWQATSLTPGGANTQIQYNNSGAFAGASGITTDGTNLTIAAFTASRVLISDASKHITSSSVTTTTLGFLDATSSIQTQLNGKQATGNYITALTGDISATGPGSVVATLPVVNGNVGAFTNANITVNAKGLITAASSGSPGGVTSATGTANQVLVNGTSGSPQTGAITLTLPQSIATSSSPAFQNLTLGSTTLGGLILNDTTGTPRTITWEAPTTVASSYVLKLPTAQGGANTAMVNDGSGNLSWGATGAGSVTQNTYTVGTASGTYTGSTTVFNLPFTYVQDGRSLQVMYNGQVLVSGVDYSETSSTSVTFTSALTVGYTAVFRYITPQTPSNTSVAQYANFVVGTPSGTYTGSTTVYNLPFAYTQDAKSLQVFYDGVQLVPGDDYTETTSTSITTTQALVSGQKIAFRTISTIGNAASITKLRENYIVGTPSGNYTGSTTVFNLINTYTPGGINLEVFLDGDLQTVGAGVDYVETNPTTVTFNNVLVANQKVTFLFSQTAAATGVVTSATAGQLAYYASNGSTVAGTNDPTGIVSIDGSFIGVGRNRIVNGEMLFDQANAQTDLTVNSSAVFYSSDQFWGTGVPASGVYVLANDSSGPTGFTNSLRATCTTADGSIGATDEYAVQTPIEGYNIRDFMLGTASAKTFTLSFWVKSSLTGIYSGAFANNGATRCYTFEYTVNSANTWEYKTVTAVGETTGTWVSNNGIGMIVTWSLAVGSNFQAPAGSWGTTQVFGTANQVNWMSSNTSRTWAITGVQLEIGSVATAFERRPYHYELALCQRYYEKSYLIGTKPATVTGTNITQFISSVVGASEVWGSAYTFKVEKRATPTMILYNANTGATGTMSRTSTAGVTAAEAVSAQSIGTKGFGVTSTASNKPYSEGHWVADARL